MARSYFIFRSSAMLDLLVVAWAWDGEFPNYPYGLAKRMESWRLIAGDWRWRRQ